MITRREFWEKVAVFATGVFAIFRGKASLGSSKAELPRLPDTPWELRKKEKVGDTFNANGIRWKIIDASETSFSAVPDYPYTGDDYRRNYERYGKKPFSISTVTFSASKKV